MNPHILENAAIYVNSYRNAMARRGIVMDHAETFTLRDRVTRSFGATYAAILVN